MREALALAIILLFAMPAFAWNEKGHLVGDIHQPLHCVALKSTEYPEGDRGGNSIRIRIASSPTNLHSFWDGLLGRGLTAGAIGKDVAEIEAVMKEKAETLKPALDAQKTPDSWAREGGYAT
jgi:S1/P1 Nuclease